MDIKMFLESVGIVFKNRFKKVFDIVRLNFFINIFRILYVIYI